MSSSVVLAIMIGSLFIGLGHLGNVSTTSFSVPNVLVDDSPGTVFTPSVAVDGGGKLHAVWLDLRSGEYNISYSGSTDSGASWSPSVAIDDSPPSTFVSTPALAVDTSGGPYDGYVYVAFQDFRDADSHIYLAVSQNGGSTWLPNVRVDSAAAGISCSEVSMAVDTDGTVYVTWVESILTATPIFFSRSDDGGSTWSAPVLVGASLSAYNTNPEVATNDPNTVYLSWEEHESFHSIMCARSDNDGGTWTPFVVVQGSDMVSGEDIAIDGLGTVYAAWSKVVGIDSSIFSSSSSTQGSTWAAPVRVDDDTTGSNQYYPRMGIGPGGMYLVWEDYRNGDPDIYFSESRDGGLTWGDGLANNNDVRVDDTDVNPGPGDDSSNQQRPDIAVAGYGIYALWSDQRNGASSDVYFASFITNMLLVTELRDSPDGGELVEIHNMGVAAFDLAGYHLAIDGVQVDLTPLGSISPGAYMTVGDPPSASLQVPVTLGDEGGTLSLVNATGATLDQVGYGQNGRAPDPLTGESSSRTRSGGAYLDIWTRDPTPTFGNGLAPWTDEQNDAPPVNAFPEVVLNEVFFNPALTADGFVELYYLGNTTLDITGYKLVCDSEYSIGPAALDTTDNHFFLRYPMAPGFFSGMTPGGDNVYLYDSTGRLLDMAGWSSAHALNATMSRLPEGNGTYDGYDDQSSFNAGWRFNQPPTLALIEIGPDQAGEGNPGEVASYNLTVTNKQPATDYIDITNSTPDAGWSVAFFDALGINPLADNNGNGVPDVGLLASGASVNITVRVGVSLLFPLASPEVILVFGRLSSIPLGSDSAMLSTVALPHLEPGKTANPTTIYIKDAGALGFNNVTTVTLKVMGAGIPVMGGLFPADVLFVIDDTGSMGDEIDSVKNNVNYITDRLIENVSDIRFGLVSYKDALETHMDLDLTYDVGAFKTAIMALMALGGGDYPEDVEGALQLGRTASWRTGSSVTRIMILIGDAPGHDPIRACQNAADAYLIDGIITNTIATPPDPAPDPFMLLSFQWIAENGSGIYRHIPNGNPSDPDEFPDAIINDVLAHMPSLTVAGSDPDITDSVPMINEVLPDHIELVPGTFRNPVSGMPKNPDHVFYNPTNTVLQWEVGQILINETWSVSFDVTSTMSGWVPVGVYPDSNVTYSRPDGNGTTHPFPEVFINVLVPSLVPPHLNGIGAAGGNVNITWAVSSAEGANYYEVYGGPAQTSIDLDTASMLFATPHEPSPAQQWWAEFPFDHVAQTEYYFLVRAVNDTAPLKRSTTSNTVGYYTMGFGAGLNTFSLPLEPFAPQSLDALMTQMGASSISWLDPGDAWQTYPLNPAAPAAQLGEGYVVELPSPSSFVFTGEPASMIIYNEGFGFDASTRDDINASVGLNGDITVSWTPIPGADTYLVLRASQRDGFHSGIPPASYVVSAPPFVDPGAASLEGELYYMVVPRNNTLGDGASTYSIGVITANYSGNHMFGLPLKPTWGDLSADWYADQIPNCLGIVFLENGQWRPHFKEFPEGVYDTTVVIGRGYELTVFVSTRFSYVGW